MNNFKLLLTCIFFTLTITACKAQDSNWIKLKLESMHAELNNPKGYALYKNNLGDFWCNDGNVSSGPLYTLIKSDKSVLISIVANKSSKKELKIIY